MTVSGADLTLEQLRAFEQRRDIETLTIWGGAWNSESLEPLSRVTWLKGLVLGEMPVDDGVFRRIRAMRELEYLNLGYTNVAGDFSALEGLPLRDVRLEGCRRVTDQCAFSLARFPTLRQLEIHMTGLTDTGLKALAALALEILWLGPRITDEGVRALARIETLRHLDLCAHNVTDEGVEALAALRRLEILWLTRCRISDGSVCVLSTLSALRELNVNDTGVSAEGLRRLRESLPNCRLVPPE